mgnify:CR=1 FL=1
MLLYTIILYTLLVVFLCTRINYKKIKYARKVVNSCKTERQRELALKWYKKVLLRYEATSILFKELK